MSALCFWDDPSKSAAERIGILATSLSDAVNAGEVTEDSATLLLSAAFILRHVQGEVTRLQKMEQRLNQISEDARLEVREEAMAVVRRYERFQWVCEARRGNVTVYSGKREQMPTEQWADNSALGVS